MAISFLGNDVVNSWRRIARVSSALRADLCFEPAVRPGPAPAPRTTMRDAHGGAGGGGGAGSQNGVCAEHTVLM